MKIQSPGFVEFQGQIKVFPFLIQTWTIISKIHDFPGFTFKVTCGNSWYEPVYSPNESGQSIDANMNPRAHLPCIGTWGAGIRDLGVQSMVKWQIEAVSPAMPIMIYTESAANTKGGKSNLTEGYGDKCKWLPNILHL